ncbi:unnamed protein product [Paramecium primaurelia]|uniref:Uncharacterized protein n=1 Tax=Paramecium primaurelia TaxID=5886 RepID=A0A8S1PFK3_PARPR|nr:unnamed protein product [Paramecium primaurelia]
MDLICQNQGHKNLIEFVCMKDSCQECRFSCFECLQGGNHKNHIEDVQKFSAFLNLIKQQSFDYDDLMNKLENLINHMNNQCGELKKGLEMRFKEITQLSKNFNITHFNEFSSCFFSFQKNKEELYQLITESIGSLSATVKNSRKILCLEEKSHQQITNKELKPFRYELINQIKDEYIFAFAFNKEANILVAGYESSKIKVFDFQQGQLRQMQELSNHNKRVRCIYFLQKSLSFISGSYDRSIILWEAQENKIFNCKQVLEGHTDDINCLIINNNDDVIISGSDDKTIRIWIKNDKWQSLQTLTYHNGSVFCISMNETQNQLISCAADNLIVVSQKDQDSSLWNIQQTIKVEWGSRLCFISNTLFTYQPYNKKQMIIYEQNKLNQQFVKQKEIAVKFGKDCFWYFPQKYIQSKQLLLNKNGSSLNLIKIKENGEFLQEQIIDFDDNYIHGAISDDGEYLITWDCKSEEIQIRQYCE